MNNRTMKSELIEKKNMRENTKEDDKLIKDVIDRIYPIVNNYNNGIGDILYHKNE